MTLSHERFNSLRNCKDYLESVLKMEQRFPISKKDSVEKAYRLLKHFPDDEWISRLQELYNIDLKKRLTQKRGSE